MAEAIGAAPVAASAPETPLPAPPPPPPLKGLREKMVAAAQAMADERRSQSRASPLPVQSPVSIRSSTRPVIDGSTLRTEERQKLARERREEREKQNAARETQLLEKEKKARLQYEKQLEEKQRRMKEQKLKEQQRRAAVEEKRKQKLEEDKERYEAVLHRSLERSQRLESRQKRWSWGGLGTDAEGKQGSKRSTSSANLKQAETALHKRLSSSAARLNSPSKGTTKRSSSLNRLNHKVPPNSEQPEGKPFEEEQKARRSQFSPVEGPGLNRLLTPTQASLARSKSAAAFSADGRDPTASSSASNLPAKVPQRSRSTDRLKVAAVSLPGNVSPETAQKLEAAKESSSTGRRTPSPSLTGARRSPSPASVGKRAASPSGTRQKPHPISPKRQGPPPSPVSHPKPAPVLRPSITPNVLNVSKKPADPACRPKERAEGPEGQEAGAASAPHPCEERGGPATMSKGREDTSGKTVTATAEEAAKILAAKRRLAREEKERAKQERAKREEEERIVQEVLEGEAGLQKLGGEKRAGEEEEQILAEKERVREEQEKMAELQLQREEAETRALEEAEKQQQERDRIMRQNKRERMERKKRIEEIMRRTRKAEQSEAKNEDKSNEEDDGVEEDQEPGLEKQDKPEKGQYGKSFEDTPKLVFEPSSKMDRDDVFVNGGDPVDLRNDGGGNSGFFPPAKEASLPAKETSEISHIGGSQISDLNGKAALWDFEEILELGTHPETTETAAAADPAAQSPRLAFEEGSSANSLTKVMEAASEL